MYDLLTVIKIFNIYYSGKRYKKRKPTAPAISRQSVTHQMRAGVLSMVFCAVLFMYSTTYISHLTSNSFVFVLSVIHVWGCYTDHLFIRATSRPNTASHEVLLIEARGAGLFNSLDRRYKYLDVGWGRASS